MTPPAAVVELELRRLTGDETQLVATDWMLEKSLGGLCPESGDAALDALVMAQGFRTTGREAYLDAALKSLNRADAGRSEGRAQLAATTLLDGMSMTHPRCAEVEKAYLAALNGGATGREFQYALSRGLCRGWIPAAKWQDKVSGPKRVSAALSVPPHGRRPGWTCWPASRLLSGSRRMMAQ